MSTSQNNQVPANTEYMHFLITELEDGAIMCQYICDGLGVPFNPFESNLAAFQLYTPAADGVPQSVSTVWFPMTVDLSQVQQIFGHYVHLNVQMWLDNEDSFEGNPPADPTLN
jgi:hypothetical protein